MSVRRLLSALSVSLVASVTVVAAQPKKDPVAPAAPVAPAPTAPAATAPAAGSAAGSAAPAPTPPPIEEEPPADMDGISEDPRAPRGFGDEEPTAAPVPAKVPTTGFPIQEALRPINLPQYMSEVSLGLGAIVEPFATTGQLRGRFGLTREVQLGLTYLIGGFYAEKDFLSQSTADAKFHPGKAVGLDVTVSLQRWISVRVGVPVYVDPIAVGLTLGAPLRFYLLGGKLTLGGMEDLLYVKVSKFVPSFEYESQNAAFAEFETNNTAQSPGFLRPSAFAIYQYKDNVALIGRFGARIDFEQGDTGQTLSFLRVGAQYSPRPRIDLGLTLGFDNLAQAGTFAPSAYLNVRI